MIARRPAGGWSQIAAVMAIVALAVALRLFAYNPWDQHHPDEFYQYLEQANRLVSGYGIVPWESRYGIRNALIPQFLALPMWLGNLIAPDGILPIHLARLSFAVLCLLALAGAWGIGAARSQGHALVALFVAAVWYDSVQFSVLLLSESAATAVISCGAALLLLGRPERQRRLWLAGFLLALGVLLRFQYAPFVGVLVLATARLDWRTWRGLAIGSLAALALGAVSDLANGQVPMAWIFENLRMNIGEGRAAEFGEEGPLYYPRMIHLALGLAAPGIVACALLAGRRYWPLILALAVNIAMHTLVGHKEYRFVWLSVFLILVLGAVGSVNVAEWLMARRSPARKAGWLTLLVLCAGWFGLSQTVLGEAATKRLKLKGGAYSMAAFDSVAHPEVCGISVSEDKSAHLVKALLRRDIPIYLIPQEMADGLSSLPPETVQAANATIADGDLPFNPEYQVIACHERTEQKACLLIRPGGCDRTAGKDHDLQNVMLRTGM